MEDFIFSASVVMPLLILLTIGYFLRRIEVFTEEYVNLTNKVSFKIFLPIMLLVSIISQQGNVTYELGILAFSALAIVVIVVFYMIVIPIFEKDNPKRGSIVQAMFRSNVLLYGIPIIYNMYGGADLAPVVMVTLVLTIFNNIVTVIVFSYFSNSNRNWAQIIKKMVRDIVINPPIIAAAIGIAVISFDIRVPFLINQTLNSLSAVAAPIALLALGGSFQVSQVRRNLKSLIPITAARMIMHPLLVGIAAVFVGFRGPELAALVITFASPTAVSSLALAQAMGGDGEIAGQIIVSTTMVSCFSIFGFIYVLSIMNLV